MEPEHQQAANQVIVDVGDFIPDEYTLRFSICGRSYEAQYAEATVDEVLLLMAETQGPDTKGAALIAHRRAVVAGFLPRHLTQGDKDQLAEDLKLLPYTSLRDSLDIFTLYRHLTERFKKKELGEWTPENPPTHQPSSLLGKLLSFFERAKAD